MCSELKIKKNKEEQKEKPLPFALHLVVVPSMNIRSDTGGLPPFIPHQVMRCKRCICAVLRFLAGKITFQLRMKSSLTECHNKWPAGSGSVEQNSGVNDACKSCILAATAGTFCIWIPLPFRFVDFPCTFSCL